MRQKCIENIDDLVENLINELSTYFLGMNYIVYFIGKPIPLNGKSISVDELLKPYIDTRNRDYKRDNFKKINIQGAKSLLKKSIIDEELIQGRKINENAIKRLDKLWQLISHYVSFYESEIYFSDNLSDMGIFWNCTILIVDKKSDYAFFLSAGAWD